MKLRRLPEACLLALSVAGCSSPSSSTGGGATTTSTSIEVLVDDLGIPHIYASNDEDLFYGYGYQIAKDRLLQLEMFRLVARGRRSEVLPADHPGVVGTTAMDDDKLVRMFNLEKWGRLDAALMRDEDQERWALVQSWVAGVNARVAEVRGGVVPPPLGFGPDELDFMPGFWEEDDPFIAQKMAHLALDQTILYEVLLTLTDIVAPDALSKIEVFKPATQTYTVPPEDRPVTLAPGKDRSRPAARAMPLAAESLMDMFEHVRGPRPASNNWVVDGRFTENGKPIVAGDPHLQFNQSGLLYAVHLDSKERGGTFDTAGFAFVSAPGLMGGQTDKVVYAPTSAFADVMDMWAVETVEGGVKIGEEVVPVETREEIVRSKDGNDQSLVITDVPGYGVLFPLEFVGVPIALAPPGHQVLIGWTGFKQRSSRYFLELNRVQSVDEFDDAVRRIPEMTYNFVAADANAITYRVGVETPKRAPIAPGREPWKVMDGSDPLAFWQPGSLPADELPHGRAAERGYIVTANNDPFGFSEDGNLGNDPWYYGAFFDPGWRAQRIESQIEGLIAQKKLGPADMQVVQMDTHSLIADTLVPLITAAHARVASDPDLADFRDRHDIDELVSIIGAWDRRMLRDSKGALAFHALAHLLLEKTIADDLMLPPLYDRILEEAPFYLLKVVGLALSGEYPNAAQAIDDKSTPDVIESADRIVLMSLDRTAAWLTEKYGSVDADYRFGDMHVSDFDDAFGTGVALDAHPSDGGEDTVNVAHSVFGATGQIADQWVSRYGPAERMVGSFADDGTPELWVNFPVGNVADPASPHFDDHMQGWLDGKYEKVPFKRAEVEARVQMRTTVERE